jgi:hypothetical protein
MIRVAHSVPQSVAGAIHHTDGPLSTTIVVGAAGGQSQKRSFAHRDRALRCQAITRGNSLIESYYAQYLTALRPSPTSSNLRCGDPADLALNLLERGCGLHQRLTELVKQKQKPRGQCGRPIKIPSQTLIIRHRPDGSAAHTVNQAYCHLARVAHRAMWRSRLQH